jgi:hypothetical protein
MSSPSLASPSTTQTPRLDHFIVYALHCTWLHSSMMFTALYLLQCLNSVFRSSAMDCKKTSNPTQLQKTRFSGSPGCQLPASADSNGTSKNLLQLVSTSLTPVIASNSSSCSLSSSSSPLCAFTGHPSPSTPLRPLYPYAPTSYRHTLELTAAHPHSCTLTLTLVLTAPLCSSPCLCALSKCEGHFLLPHECFVYLFIVQHGQPFLPPLFALD